MGDRTTIAWCDASWNPIRGCSRVSEGCRNCYAEQMAARFCGPGQPYDGLAKNVAPRDGLDPVGGRRAGWTSVVRLVPEHLGDPLRWRRPRRIFLASMSDPFHESLSDEDIAAVFGVMAACPQHTFLVLTKRAGRMREWFALASREPASLLSTAVGAYFSDEVACDVANIVDGWSWPRGQTAPHPLDGTHRVWPLPNVHLGVSVEDQPSADARVPDLLATPAAVRWVSAEPLLDAVDFSDFLRYHPSHEYHQERRGVDLRSGPPRGDGNRCDRSDLENWEARLGSLEASRADERLSSSAGGEGRPTLRISVSARDGSRSTHDGDGPQAGLAALPRTAAGRDDDQPQERPEGRQPPGEPGTGDALRERTPRGPRPEGGKDGASERRAQPRGEADLGAGDGDSGPAGGRREAATSGERIRGCCADDLAHCAWRSSRLWLVVGGESGPHARPFDLAWARSTIRQCREAAVPVFVKQLSARPYETKPSATGAGYDPADMLAGGLDRTAHERWTARDGWTLVKTADGSELVRYHHLRDRAGADPAEWPEDLRVRQYPEVRRHG